MNLATLPGTGDYSARPSFGNHDPRIDVAAIIDDAEDAINAEVSSAMTDPARVLSFLRLVEWTGEPEIVAALAAGNTDKAGRLLWQRLGQVAQECAEQEWLK